MNTALRGVAADGLEALSDGIADAISNAKSLGDAFKGVANQIIADLIRIAIRQAIVAPLAKALFPGGGGGGGFLSSLGSLFGGSGGGSGAGGISGIRGGRASGGYVGAGQLYRVNEGASPGRVEGFRPQGSGTVIPLGQMGALRGGGGGNIYNISVSADHSVTPDGFASNLAQNILAEARRMDAASVVGASRMAQTDLARRAKYRFR